MINKKVVLFGQTDSRSEKVRKVFENTPKYLDQRGVDVRCRMHAVNNFSRRVPWTDLLDIGCGDGSISLQLQNAGKRLTLMDLSSGMVQAAQRHVLPEFADNVKIYNKNFLHADLAVHSFDLIVTVGVLAHVDSPEEFMAKIKKVIRPGGRIIMEFTDSRHPVGWLARLWGRCREVFAPAVYATNLFEAADVFSLWAQHGFEVEQLFRYARIPLPGLHRLLGSALEYKLVQLVFGTSSQSRCGWLGNEYICYLKAE
ncbi:class I SAM-dependent methyltransferase [Granulicella arctica]|uniref:class I SAM-dependent methyltransferase n=1 Tax=Granulicella arctica TaxID=940613 RepID=UPI0021E0A4B2|nr:class I SAM-dependent methyltransferase [Granulicella arctica]